MHPIFKAFGKAAIIISIVDVTIAGFLIYMGRSARLNVSFGEFVSTVISTVAGFGAILFLVLFLSLLMRESWTVQIPTGNGIDFLSRFTGAALRTGYQIAESKSASELVYVPTGGRHGRFAKPLRVTFPNPGIASIDGPFGTTRSLANAWGKQ